MLGQFTFPGTFAFPRLGGVNPLAVPRFIELSSLILDFSTPLFVALKFKDQPTPSLSLDFSGDRFAQRDIEAF